VRSLARRLTSLLATAAVGGGAFLGACASEPERSGRESAETDALGTSQQAFTTLDGCVGDVGQTLAGYAQECTDAMGGIEVPAFNCETGIEIPDTQGDGLAYPAETCDRPNVLNGACDKGSKFQVFRCFTKARRAMSSSLLRPMHPSTAVSFPPSAATG
jgi:hypothetical protein